METRKFDGEIHCIGRILVDEYIFCKEAAPYGYKISNEVKITLENTRKIQKVFMRYYDETSEVVNYNQPMEQKLPQTGDNMNG